MAAKRNQIREKPPASNTIDRDTLIWSAAAVVLLGIFVLYLAFPDKVYIFDGIMFSSIIERSTEEWRSQLFNGRHLVFNPFMMYLRDALGAIHLPVRAYPLIQEVNALFGVLGIAIYFRLLFRLTRDRVIAGLGGLILGLSYCYWSRATEGQVYMLMTFWALATGLSAVILTEEGTASAVLVLIFSNVVAVLFHAANIVLLPVTATALWGASRRSNNFRVWWSMLGLGAGISIPYILAFHLISMPRLLPFITQATDFNTLGQTATWGQLLGHYLRGGSSIKIIPETIFAAIAVPPTGTIISMIGGIFLLGLGAMSAANLWLKRSELRPKLLILCLWGAGFVILDLFWHGGVYFWGIPCAAGLALLVLGVKELLDQKPEWRKGVLACLTLTALFLGVWNFRRGILPQSRLDNNVGYDRSIFVREHTVPLSWIIISGFGFPNAKVYLPYFAHRTREVFEYYLENLPRQEVLSEFSRFIKRNRDSGVPMYFLSDMIEDKSVEDVIETNWKISRQDISDCLGPGIFLKVAEEDPHFRVFLFVPKNEADRLFVGLSYNVYGEKERSRLLEADGLLQALARGMTPAQRHRIPQIMQENDFGTALMNQGYWIDMNSESQVAAAKRRQEFKAYEQSPDFHMRLGNLYRLLGLYDDTRREWTAVYQANHDPRLAAFISKLPR